MDQLQYCQVASAVGSVDVGVTAGLIGQTNIDLGCILNDMKHRKDKPQLGVEHYAASVGFGNRLRGRQIEPFDQREFILLEKRQQMGPGIEAAQFAGRIGGGSSAELAIAFAAGNQDAGNTRLGVVDETVHGRLQRKCFPGLSE